MIVISICLVTATATVVVGLCSCFSKWRQTRNSDYFHQKTAAAAIVADDGAVSESWSALLWLNLRRLIMYKDIEDSVTRLYNRNRHKKVCAIRRLLLKPIWMIRDPALIVRVTVKDHDHFTDRRLPVDRTIENFAGRCMSALGDTRWRKMRATLVHAFTGNKLRQMLELVVECADQTRGKLLEEENRQQRQRRSAGGSAIEMRDLFMRLISDVITTTVFGVRVNSIRDPTNDFYAMAQDIIQFPAKFNFYIFLFNTMPWLMNVLKIGLFTEPMRTLFIQVMNGSIKYRTQNHIYRPDLIHLLIEGRRKEIIDGRQQSTETRECYSQYLILAILGDRNKPGSSTNRTPYFN